MLIVRKLNAYLGILLMVIGGFCPVLKVKIIFNVVNLNLCQINQRLIYITYALLALVLFFLTTGKLKAFRFVAALNFIWVILMAFAVWFKSNNYLGKVWVDYLIGKTIHFQWGWIVLILGAFLLITSAKKEPLKQQV